MTNNKDATSTNKASIEGQPPRNDNVNVNVTGTAVTGSSSPNPNPSITNQVNVGRGSSVTPPGSNRGSPSIRGSPSGRGSSTPRRGSPSVRGSPSGRMSPSSGRGSPSSGRGSSSSGRAGQTNQIGERNFTPVSLEISLGGGSMGSMVPTGGSSQQRSKRKAEIIAPEGVVPICSVCKRSNFCSWKALFGHMRCHPERQWRGCFPPPGFEEAQQALEQGPQQGEGSGALRGFDLNEANDPEEENEGGGAGDGGFDLNMPPADDNDDDDKDGGGGAAAAKAN